MNDAAFAVQINLCMQLWEEKVKSLGGGVQAGIAKKGGQRGKREISPP